MKIFGAKAVVFLKYSQEIELLSNELSSGLELPNFYFDTYPDPPHEIFASCEVLGFEIWLNKSSEVNEFNYILEIQTQLRPAEVANGYVHDLSQWLARYVSIACGIESCVISKDIGSYVIFINGETQEKN